MKKYADNFCIFFIRKKLLGSIKISICKQDVLDKLINKTLFANNFRLKHIEKNQKKVPIFKGASKKDKNQ
ncbi:hypothetical protein BpHYR1_020088 [Brachionus plicatilis]|uniref:Uncharacterized protein n=1 Tax=Brachionus plicatilis TaxID=10195 RepID=A0A3M7PZV9_BRAPC|nr:hypothetical protein BpHYR1_020088 [Brachionus plicatilis]